MIVCLLSLKNRPKTYQKPKFSELHHKNLKKPSAEYIKSQLEYLLDTPSG